MSIAIKKNSQRLITLFICALILGSIIFAPGVGAASESTKTETEISSTNDNTTDDLVQELTARANTIDEAKKQAQATVKEQLSIIAQQEEEESEAQTEEEETEAETDTEATAADTYEETESSGSSSTGEDSQSDYSGSAVGAPASTGYLVDTDNYDPNYVSYSISLNDADRDMAERIIMGEAGSTGYTGMALVAQCLRDAYATGAYGSIAELIQRNGYYGSTSITPSATCKEVVNYIFDQGGAAVQHRILIFYASNYCSSSWHESQNFVTSYGYVRFFDMW